METMKAIVKTESKEGGTEVQDVPVPKVGPTDIKIKIHANSICGTDVHIYTWDKWAQSRVKTPQIHGHELCGEIVEVGNAVKTLEVGDFVSAESHIVCNKCKPCLTGNHHICENCEIIGVDRDGCWSDYSVIPAQVAWKVSPNIDRDDASIMEPLGNAVHLCQQEELSFKTVLLLGAGPAGLFTTAIAKTCNANNIIVSDVNDHRLNLAKKIGATHTINAKELNVEEEVKDITHGGGADIVMDLCGIESAIRSGMRSITNGGTFILFGLATKEIPVDINRFIFSGITVKGVTGRRLFNTWEQADRILQNPHFNANDVITHKLGFDDYEKGFELMKAGQCGKIVLKH